jgi:hypothetical protein
MSYATDCSRAHVASRLAAAAALIVLGYALAEGSHAESLGPLHPGMTAEQVHERIGAPTGTEPQPPACPGQPATNVWDYGHQGLVVVMAGNGADARLQSASSFGDNGLTTGKGIGIGATYAQVAAAYPNASESDASYYRVDLKDHRLEIRFSADDPPRVAGILITDEPELVYDEEGECGTELAPQEGQP